MNIVIVGSINVDFSAVTRTLPVPRETVTASEFYTSPGGKGANQAVAAARLGASVSMIGSVGDDVNGNYMKNILEKENINTTGISVKTSPTGNAQITIQGDGLNTIVVYPGANFELSNEDIDKHLDVIKQADMIIMQLEIPIEVVSYVLDTAEKESIPVILNPAPAQTLNPELMKKVTILTPNETELTFLTGEKNINKGAQKLIAQGVEKVVVTLGELGSYYLDNQGNEYKVPAVSVKSIDSTAAGDAFNAALAVGLNKYENIEAALMFSNKVGAVTTTQKGAITSLPYLTDIK